jgi:hypothetical protein
VPQGDAAVMAEGMGEHSAGAPLLAGRYLLLIDRPLPELDAPGATACAVQDTHSPSNSLFARVLAPGTIPRKDLMVPLRGNRDIQIMRPVEWGVVPWPATRRNAFSVVFDRPSGGPLVAPNAAGFPPMSVSDITGRVLVPAIRALAQLARRGLTHRAVRPDNLFLSGDVNSQLLLGECVTSPPAFGQPAAFETIESAMTPPLGRGLGTYNDDLYALGATLLALALGRMPLAGTPTEDIVAAKLARGSFITLLGGDRVPFGLREVLRGLLADNVKERWGYTEVEQWLHGGMNKALHDNPELRMDRPFPFRGKDHWGFRELAHEFGKDWRAASSAIIDEQFSKWATRRLRDADLADDVTKTIKSARIEAGANPEPDARLVAQLCAILDPEGPIRYKGISACPDGLGPLMAQAMRDGAREETNAICDLLAKGLAIDWLTWRVSGSNADLALALRPYKNLQQLLRHAGPGYGPERCLYELNPQLPCQSKGVEPYYVDTVAELLPTLERVVKSSGGLPAVFDRHFAAFIACRVKKNLDRDFAALEEARGDPVAAKLGMLKLFAWLQAEHGPVSLPALCVWLAQDLEPACDRLASKTMRAEVRRRLLLAGDSGDLSQLYNVLQDRAMLTRDEQGRRAALQRFVATRRDIAALEAGDFGEAARASAWRLSAALGVAAAIGSLIVVAAS